MTEVRCPQCNNLIYETGDGLEGNIEYTTEKCPYCDYDPNPAVEEEEEQQQEQQDEY